MALEKSLGGKKKSKGKSSKKKSSKKRIIRTSIDHGEDGSHVIRHSFDQGDGGEPSIPDSMHGVSDSDGLLAHMQGQFGGQLPSPQAGAGGAAGLPTGQTAG